MANPVAITLHALGAESGAWQTQALDLRDPATGIQRTGARLTLLVTAVGDNGLAVAVETSPDGSTGWRTVDEFELVTSPGSHDLALHGLERYVRASSPDAATFALTGYAHQLFVGEADIYAEIRREAFEGRRRSEIADALLKASDDILDALASAYTPPILSVGDSVRQRGAAIAAWRALCAGGLQPEGADLVPMENAKEAHAWLYRVSQGRLRPPGIVDSTPHTYEGGAVVASSPRRGW
ncbi:MAG: hypothetical protein DIU78_009820 [Pseudomonadota bacterium]